MARLIQYCESCFRTFEFEAKPGTRVGCEPCQTLSSPWSTLKPTVKFMVAWQEFGIDNLAPAWANNLGEQRFDDSRRRLDFSWPEFKLGVEIDGYGPGHLNMGQINKDHEKVNDAAVLGWTILRYTSQMVGSRKGAEHAVEQVVGILSHLIDCRPDRKTTSGAWKLSGHIDCV